MAYEKKDKSAGGHTKFNYRKAYESGRGTKDLEPMRMKKRGLIGALQRLLPGGASGMELIRDPETGEILYGDQWDEYPHRSRPYTVQMLREDFEDEINLQMRDKAGYKLSDREPTLLESFIDEIGKGIQRRKTRRKAKRSARKAERSARNQEAFYKKATKMQGDIDVFKDAYDAGEFGDLSRQDAWKEFNKPFVKTSGRGKQVFKHSKQSKKAKLSRKYDNNTYTEGE